MQDLPSYDSLKDPDNAADLLAATAVLKLNGGLGTSMGLEKAKSLLVVKEGKTFLDLIAEQVGFDILHRAVANLTATTSLAQQTQHCMGIRLVPIEASRQNTRIVPSKHNAGSCQMSVDAPQIAVATPCDNAGREDARRVQEQSALHRHELILHVQGHHRASAEGARCAAEGGVGACTEQVT